MKRRGEFQIRSGMDIPSVPKKCQRDFRTTSRQVPVERKSIRNSRQVQIGSQPGMLPRIGERKITALNSDDYFIQQIIMVLRADQGPPANLRQFDEIGDVVFFDHPSLRPV